MIAVSRAHPEDDPAVARLHCSEIGDGFLASLGPRFLRRLYRRIRLHDGSFLIVAHAGDGTVAGFVAGTEHTGALYRAFLRRDAASAVLVAAPRLVIAARRAVETLRYGVSGSGRDAADLPAAELLALAVGPAFRRQGVGRDLVAAFADEMRSRHVERARVVVGGENTAALALYRAGGFATYGRRDVHRGSPSEVLVWSRS